MVRIALGIVLLATGLSAAEPEAAVVGFGSLEVAAIWDSPAFLEARSPLEGKASRVKPHLLQRCGIAPADLARITTVSFKIASGEQEFTPSALLLYTSRLPLDPAAVAKATSYKVLPAAGNDALPGVSILEDTAKSHLFVGPKWVAVVPSLTENDLRLQTEFAMVKKAVAREADRAALHAKEQTTASLSVDIAEYIRGEEYSLFNQSDLTLITPGIAPLLRARVATASVKANALLSAKLELTFATAEEAQAAKPIAELALRQLQRRMDESDILDLKTLEGRTQQELQHFVGTLLNGGLVVRNDRVLIISTSQPITPRIAASVAQSIVIAEHNTAKMESQNNLRTLIAAAHNDININESGFIENISTEKGRPLLSWRVRLLPFMGHEALYKEFKLDEAWDSEHNKKLIAKMPKTFMAPSPREAKEGTTFYQAFVGKKGAASRPILQDGDASGLTINAISDGTSNTIAVIEAAEAVAWTKPDDLPFDNDGTLPKLGGHFEGGFNVAFCDGSVRFLKDTIPEATLKAAITANGAETLTLPEE